MQVMRVARFGTRPDVDPVRYEAFRKWMAGQPGLRALYHVNETGGGSCLSVSIWDSREAVLAMKDRVFPGGPLGIRPDSVTLFDVESSEGPA